MNRFDKPSLKKRIEESVNFSLVMFIVIMAVFMLGISMLSGNNASDERQTLLKALHKDVVHCYAVEGYYPPSLSYIENHYGLTYDHDKYLIDYEMIGSNIMPTITVVALSDEAGTIIK